MRRAKTLLALLLGLGGCARHAASPAAAVADPAGVVTVTLSDFAYTPERLHLVAGQPVRLRLVNASGHGHDFSAPRFFAASRIEAPAAAPGGTVEVPPHGTVELALTPLAPGRYDVVCTHPLHELFGMAGGVDVVSP